MATCSFRVRKLTTNRQKPSAGGDSLFNVNRGPVTPSKRDVSQLEDYRQRAFIERMKDAFRTISFRSEPTIGEEDLVRRNDSRRSTEGTGQAPSTHGHNVMDKKCEELVQNLVPDCYEHLQNFHHYRSDMARLDSGFKVLYLSGNDGAAKSEKDLRRVYGQKSKGSQPNTSVNGHLQMLPGSKIRSTRMANMVSKMVLTPSQKRKGKTNLNFDKNSKVKSAKASNSGTLHGKDSQKTNANDSTELRLMDSKQGLPCQRNQRQFKANGDNELPCFKLEHAPANPVENQPSFHRLASDILPRPPMTSPDDMSRRSSIRTLVFESESDVTNSERMKSPSPRKTTHKDSNHGRHYIAPFHSRFPHLKASSDASSLHGFQQKRSGDKVIPSWQQYRILCDAFRPNISPERLLHQKNNPNGYKKPKFATSTELESYIDVVSETNNIPALHLS